MFFKFVNFVSIDLKIGKHIDWTYLCTCKKYIDQNNLIFVSMATKYPIIKHIGRFSKL